MTEPILQTCMFRYPQNAITKEGDAFPKPRSVVMFEADPEYRIVSNYITWAKQTHPNCFAAPGIGKSCEDAIITDIVPRLCVHIRKKIEFLNNLWTEGAKTICISPPTATSVMDGFQDGCLSYKEAGSNSGQRYTPLKADYYADAGFAAGAYVYVCQEAERISNAAQWLKATADEQKASGDPQAAAATNLQLEILHLGRLLYAANAAASQEEPYGGNDAKEDSANAATAIANVRTAILQESFAIFFEDQKIAAMQNSFKIKRDAMLSGLRQKQMIPSVGYTAICGNTADSNYFQARQSGIASAASSVIAAPKTLPKNALVNLLAATNAPSSGSNSMNLSFSFGPPVSLAVLGLKNTAEMFLARENWGAALKLLTEALAIAPHPALYNDRALAYEGLKQYPEALSDAKEAVRLHSTPGHYLLRSRIFAYNQLFNDAILDANAVCPKVASSDDCATAYNNISIGLCNGNQHESALKTFEKALQYEPNDPTIRNNAAQCYNNFGIALFKQNKKSAARKAFQRALELNPSDTTIQNNLKVAK